MSAPSAGLTTIPIEALEHERLDQVVRYERVPQPFRMCSTGLVVDADTDHGVRGKDVEDLQPCGVEVAVVGYRDDRFAQPTPP